MTFEGWLKKQNKRDDMVGDLARDYIQDGKKVPFTYTYMITRGACDGACKAYKKAKKEYVEYVKQSEAVKND